MGVGDPKVVPEGGGSPIAHGYRGDCPEEFQAFENIAPNRSSRGVVWFQVMVGGPSILVNDIARSGREARLMESGEVFEKPAEGSSYKYGMSWRYTQKLLGFTHYSNDHNTRTTNC